MTPALPSRVAFLAISCAVLACGKRSYVASMTDAAGPSSSATTFAAPHIDDSSEPIPPSPLATTCKGVSLKIVAVNPKTKPADLELLVELWNDAAEHVPLLLPGDGSTAGRRNPTLTYALTPNDVAPQPGCGNMNPLDPSDFVFLAPGEHRHLPWTGAFELPTHPGFYTVRATYRNDPKSDALGDNRPGPMTERLIARARRTVPCTVTSDAIGFVWPEITR